MNHDLIEKKILVITAVEAESEAVLRGLGSDKRFEVLAGGVGPVASAVSTAKALASSKYDLVISAGIAGGFAGKADVGSLVVATEIVAADLGVKTAEGFNSIDELGFGSARIQVDKDLVKKAVNVLKEANLPVSTGPVLTASTVTGTAESAEELAARVPGAAAEAMEGFGVAFAAQDAGIPILEIRAISNAVGPRDRSAWRIKEALSVLEKAIRELKEVLVW